MNVGVVGLGFGRAFLPIYAEHPDVGRVAICDPNEDLLQLVGEEMGIEDRYAGIDELLADNRYDVVHIASPVSTHVPYTLAVLGAGKHCAAAVPIATSLEDVAAVIRAEDESGRNYMMMETSVYGREYLYVEGLKQEGRLGDLTFLRGMHIQDLDGFPDYWMAYPPMHYITHALSPLLALTGDRIAAVTCLGTGHLPTNVVPSYANPFPTETGLFRLAGHDVVAEITMSFFAFARSYQEGFAVYGQSMGFEWGQLESELPLLFEFLPRPDGTRGRKPRETRVEPPDRPDLLPAQIARYTQPTTYDPPRGNRGAISVASHHGGSHPHLVHELVRSVVEGRPSRIDARTAATWTAPGICAHLSALASGTATDVPDYGAHPSATP